MGDKSAALSSAAPAMAMAAVFLLVAGGMPAAGQGGPPPPPPPPTPLGPDSPAADGRLVWDAAAGVHRLQWWARSGRTYFLQSSPDLATWSYLPTIEPGTDGVKEWSFAPPAGADRMFVRLRVIDQTAADVEAADFDGDGTGNRAELLAGTDPLVAEDDDRDGLPDWWELRYFPGLGPLDGAADHDLDGLLDREEFAIGYDPTAGDENGNNVPDGGEDNDGDGLTNAAEARAGTDPANADSDRDGYADGEEIAAGTDPEDPGAKPPAALAAPEITITATSCLDPFPCGWERTRQTYRLAWTLHGADGVTGVIVESAPNPFTRNWTEVARFDPAAGGCDLMSFEAWDDDYGGHHPAPAPGWYRARVSDGGATSRPSAVAAIGQPLGIACIAGPELLCDSRDTYDSFAGKQPAATASLGGAAGACVFELQAASRGTAFYVYCDYCDPIQSEAEVTRDDFRRQATVFLGSGSGWLPSGCYVARAAAAVDFGLEYDCAADGSSAPDEAPLFGLWAWANLAGAWYEETARTQTPSEPDGIVPVTVAYEGKLRIPKVAVKIYGRDGLEVFDDPVIVAPNADNDEGRPAEDGPEPRDCDNGVAAPGADDDLVKVLLAGPENIASGTIAVTLPADFRAFDAAGQPVAAEELALDLAAPSGPLAALKGGTVTLYLEAPPGAAGGELAVRAEDGLHFKPGGWVTRTGGRTP